STTSLLFSALIAMTLPALYLILGCGWLLMKTDGELRNKAIDWARMAIWPMGMGLFMVSIATPMVSESIAEKWFTLPNAILLMPIPLVCLLCYGAIVVLLNKPKILTSGYGWLIYASTVVICVMASLGLAYSIFPDIIIGGLTIWESAASVKSLQFTLVGVVITLPVILIYTVFVYRIFHGKATELSYE
ncbi:MAG: cytochrome d ubiquinol oxidase subunit II, partial [Gammaproteobacteria bacterium]|nr:cytochrome d ubiquinol oxidase subunit II [Gammaproteobacteria bacterium]MBU1831839.1 cytochrome d ubiquinol oxidase subunit II [Gammaproteobacteria bacterium]